MTETVQYVWCDLYTGANQISSPLCQSHCDSEQPPETVMVLPVFGDHECWICEREKPDARTAALSIHQSSVSAPKGAS